MNELPATIAQTDIVTLDATRADEHPAAVYLTEPSASSRRTMHGALNTIA